MNKVLDTIISKLYIAELFNYLNNCIDIVIGAFNTEALSMEFVWNTIAAFFTIAIFSFLIKDNTLYKIAESIVVGIAAGYFTILLLWTSFKPKFWDMIVVEGKWWYVIPGILGLLMYFRFNRKLNWLARYPLALYIGIGSGIAIPLMLQTFVIKQFKATMLPGNLHSWEGVNNTLIVIMVLAGLIYFFFSVPHKGIVGKTATFGIWVIMIGFGASFGYTVMARVSLLIGRIQFLLGNWLKLIE
ncbi:hypothetical protein JW979_03545 [bacterium]|nr:hypothetical protein [candidate division CSSED10-310 bacterium]